jgi:hypothetical protein
MSETTTNHGAAIPVTRPSEPAYFGPMRCCGKVHGGWESPCTNVPDVIRRAADEVARLCAGRGRMTQSGLAGRDWTMCIPRRADDSDSIFTDLIEAAAQWHVEANAAREAPEFARGVAIAAVRDFANEMGIMHDPSFTPEATRYADYLRTRDLASEYRVFCGEDPAHVVAARTPAPSALEVETLTNAACGVVKALAESKAVWERYPNSGAFEAARKAVEKARSEFAIECRPERILALTSENARLTAEVARLGEENARLGADLATVKQYEKIGARDLSDAWEEIRKLRAARSPQQSEGGNDGR